ncbi:MAG TPA: flavodoxin family protein [Dehalococcoidia bacterium]|nr:flavodoxin family protein [Dehalococcoidia bacterium]
MAAKKKIVGLSCGRINGNSEILLKEALMGAQEEGIDSEIIRAMELRVRQCTGCEACSMAMARGKESRCAIKDDDVEWILEKILVEDNALIVAGPLYHLRPNSYFESIHERMLPVMFRHPEIVAKTRVGGIISVGGGEPEWTPLGLTGFNIFMQHTRKVVDQMQVNFCGRPGTVTMREEYIKQAHQLGKNVAKAMNMPADKIKYVGPETEVSCPICHVNLVQIPDKLPAVYCPVCWVKGELKMDGKKMKIDWDAESVKYPRFSEKGIGTHLDFIKELQMKWFGQDQETGKERMKKYENWGRVIKP